MAQSAEHLSLIESEVSERSQDANPIDYHNVPDSVLRDYLMEVEEMVIGLKWPVRYQSLDFKEKHNGFKGTGLSSIYQEVSKLGIIDRLKTPITPNSKQTTITLSAETYRAFHALGFVRRKKLLEGAKISWEDLVIETRDRLGENLLSGYLCDPVDLKNDQKEKTHSAPQTIKQPDTVPVSIENDDDGKNDKNNTERQEHSRPDVLHPIAEKDDKEREKLAQLTADKIAEIADKIQHLPGFNWEQLNISKLYAIFPFSKQNVTDLLYTGYSLGGLDLAEFKQKRNSMEFFYPELVRALWLNYIAITRAQQEDAGFEAQNALDILYLTKKRDVKAGKVSKDL